MLKRIYYSLKRMKIVSNIKCAFDEKRNSLFDPYVNGDSLLISDRKERALREFKISENLSLIKTDNVYRKVFLLANEDINRGMIFDYNGVSYLVCTYQFNGRSYIVLKQDKNNFKISSADILLQPEEYYEKMSVMNPYIFRHENDLYMFYSAGETYEPDCICLAKINNLESKNIQRFPFNPIFSNSHKYFYRYDKVAFGDLIEYKGYYLLFYIGYYNVDKAYINIACCKSKDFPYFKDIPNINPLISGGLKLNAVYKPCVLIRGDNCIIYFNGRKKEHESIYYTTLKMDSVIKEISDNE